MALIDNEQTYTKASQAVLEAAADQPPTGLTDALEAASELLVVLANLDVAEDDVAGVRVSRNDVFYALPDRTVGYSIRLHLTGRGFARLVEAGVVTTAIDYPEGSLVIGAEGAPVAGVLVHAFAARPEVK